MPVVDGWYISRGGSGGSFYYFFFFPFFLSFWAQLCMEFLLNTINRDNHTLYLVLHLPYFLGGEWELLANQKR